MDFNGFFVIAMVIMLGLSGIFLALTLIDCRLYTRRCQDRRINPDLWQAESNRAAYRQAMRRAVDWLNDYRRMP